MKPNPLQHPLTQAAEIASTVLLLIPMLVLSTPLLLLYLVGRTLRMPFGVVTPPVDVAAHTSKSNPWVSTLTNARVSSATAA